MVTWSLWIGVGPEFDSQVSITLFLKYFFPNMHRFHGKASEVEIPLFQHLEPGTFLPGARVWRDDSQEKLKFSPRVAAAHKVANYQDLLLYSSKKQVILGNWYNSDLTYHMCNSWIMLYHPNTQVQRISMTVKWSCTRWETWFDNWSMVIDLATSVGDVEISDIFQE